MYRNGFIQGHVCVEVDGLRGQAVRWYLLIAAYDVRGVPVEVLQAVQIPRSVIADAMNTAADPPRVGVTGGVDPVLEVRG